MKNAIQELNEHCQKCRLPLPTCEFEQVSVTPSSWKVVMKLGDFQAIKTGENKKEAQAIAADNLKLQLVEEEIWWEQLQSTPIPKGVGGYKHKPFKKVWQP